MRLCQFLCEARKSVFCLTSKSLVARTRHVSGKRESAPGHSSLTELRDWKFTEVTDVMALLFVISQRMIDHLNHCDINLLHRNSTTLRVHPSCNCDYIRGIYRRVC